MTDEMLTLPEVPQLLRVNGKTVYSLAQKARVQGRGAVAVQAGRSGRLDRGAEGREAGGGSLMPGPESGLAKWAAWEEVWSLQRREDAGERIESIPEPPEYSQGGRGKSPDFLRNAYWRLRGKLNVPKERFVCFTEVPGRSGVETLHGWAGWTAQRRVKAILVIDEELEDASVPLADRVGLLDSAWRLLPDVAREDAAVATRLKAELQALVGPEGPSPQLKDWVKRFPPPTTHAAKKSGEKTPRKGRKKAFAQRDAEDDSLDDVERTNEDPTP